MNRKRTTLVLSLISILAIALQLIFSKGQSFAENDPTVKTPEPNPYLDSGQSKGSEPTGESYESGKLLDLDYTLNPILDPELRNHPLPDIRYRLLEQTTAEENGVLKTKFGVLHPSEN